MTSTEVFVVLAHFSNRWNIRKKESGKGKNPTQLWQRKKKIL
jgi:hypothetical protein